MSRAVLGELGRAADSARGRAAVVAALVLLFGVVAVTPSPLGAPIRRLANVGAHRSDPNSPDPIYDTTINGAAIQRAARLVDGRGTYYLAYGRADPQLAHDLPDSASLYFPPAIMTTDPAEADWVLAYHVQPPADIQVTRRIRVGAGVWLIRTEP
jgi:hypothetical protein